MSQGHAALAFGDEVDGGDELGAFVAVAGGVHDRSGAPRRSASGFPALSRASRTRGFINSFDGEIFVPLVGAVEADAFGILLGLGELEEVAEAEAAPGGSGGPALHALHARVLRFLGEAAEI